MKARLIVLFFAVCFIVSGCKDGETRKLKSPEKPVRFVHNEQPLAADLDVTDQNGRHLFRILLPEFVRAENIPGRSFLNHQIPGEWGQTNGIHWCRLRNDAWVEATIALMPGERGTLILFGIRNLSGQMLKEVAMDICVSVSHIPCPNGAWINPEFISVSEPPDRDSAGRYWYEKVAPYRLKAFTNGTWVPAHANPEKPSSIGVPPYEPFNYLNSTASLMAVESSDGKERLFQVWDSPCKVRCAFPGNSCMHLEPILADKLKIGDISFVKGEISLTDASWAEISRWEAKRYKREYNSMKRVLDKL